MIRMDDRAAAYEDVHRLASLAAEGRALGRLAHPGVPRCLDTVVSSPHPHLLLEHIPGPTLRTLINGRRRLSPGAIARLGRDLALVLDHIAMCGWVHLDMAPEQRAASELTGPPTDVFALALTLGEALLGPEIARTPAPESLPGAVGAALGAALAAWPADRPSAAELADALAPLAAPESPAQVAA